MRIGLSEFTATPGAPYLRDRLNRRPQVRALCDVMQRVDGHTVVSIDGPWGSGKTAFVKMCSAELRSRSVPVVEFNAWQQSYTNNPLVDVASAIAAELGESLSDTVKRTLIDGSWHLAKVASRGVIDRDAISQDDPAVFDPWGEAQSKVNEFKDRLAEAASPAGGNSAGRLVVLIDELDRCRPDYALELIETVRHLLAQNGIVVLLALNRAELCHSIQSLYGPKFDADRYLRRFTDLPYRLPLPAADDIAGFTNELLTEFHLDFRFTDRGQPDYSSPMLQRIATATRHNLRDLQQSIQLAAVALQSPKIGTGTQADNWGSKQKTVALIILRALDSDAYHDLAHRGDPFTAVAAMNAAITDDPRSLAAAASWDKAHEKIEASLLAEALEALFTDPQVLQGEESAPTMFEKRYADAFTAQYEDVPNASDLAQFRAKRITKATDNRLREMPSSTLRIDELTGIIDLTAH